MGVAQRKCDSTFTTASNPWLFRHLGKEGKGGWAGGVQKDQLGSRGLTRLAGFPVAKFQGSKGKSVPRGMEGTEGRKEVAGWEAGSLEDSKDKETE